MTIADAQARLRSGRTTSAGLVESSLQAIERDSARLNAFVRVWPDTARAAAREADAELKRGVNRGPLHGIPVGVKDLIDTKDLRTTYGSGIFREHVPARDGAMPERLREAGAIVVGKTATTSSGWASRRTTTSSARP